MNRPTPSLLDCSGNAAHSTMERLPLRAPHPKSLFEHTEVGKSSTAPGRVDLLNNRSTRQDKNKRLYISGIRDR
jgi:hypothetical protein